jgi:hypothetical protein
MFWTPAQKRAARTRAARGLVRRAIAASNKRLERQMISAAAATADMASIWHRKGASRTLAARGAILGAGAVSTKASERQTGSAPAATTATAYSHRKRVPYSFAKPLRKQGLLPVARAASHHNRR